MAGKHRLSEGAECFNSDEFRAFAIRWLGFDPRDEEKYPDVINVDVAIPCDGLVKFRIEHLGSRDEDAEGYWLIQRLSDGSYWSEVGRQDGLSMWVDFPEHGDKYAGKEAAEMKIKEDDWFSFDTCRAVPLKKEMKR